MKVQVIDAVELSGFKVRTTNENEMSLETANIAGLWQTFSTQGGPHLTEKSQVFGVYTNYQSDYTGEFDVLACSDEAAMAGLEQTSHVQIEAGKYLTFEAQGEMPQAVIELWGEVWGYFTQADCPHTRRYTSDFERYIGEDRVEISIAIE